MKTAMLFACLSLWTDTAFARLQIEGLPITVGSNALRFTVFDSEGKSVRFRFAGVSQSPEAAPVPDFPGNFIMLKAATWTTPANVEFVLHPFRYGSGKASNRLSVHFSTIGEEPASTAIGQVFYKGLLDSSLGIAAVVNSYSLDPVLSPGALVSIVDPSLSVVTQYSEFDTVGRYPTTLANRNVSINGFEAAILSVSGNRIDIIVPYELAGQVRAEVILRNQNGASPASSPFSVSIRESAPAIRTVTPSGRGQADSRQIAGDEWSLNSEANPAPEGSAIELFCTGVGTWDRALDTDIAFGNLSPSFPPGLLEFMNRPISLSIGGRPARILYAGTARNRPWGVLQVNVIVPFGTGPGSQPVVLRVGDYDNAAQGVTIEVKE